MDDVVLHDRLAVAPWLDPAAWRLPGVQPLDPGTWLVRDEAYAGQMALRDRLIAERGAEVVALLPEVQEAAGECYDLVLAALEEDRGYRFDAGNALRPDGVTVALDRARPLATLGRLMQADVCLMQPGAGGHVLTGAVLCFPAGWTLAEKIGRPLPGIHGPVAEYDAALAHRVQRLFNAMRPEQVLWRANAILHDDPRLFTPRREADKASLVRGGRGRYLRSEWQTLRKLPDSGAVVFTIHTTMIAVARLSEAQRAGIAGSGMKAG